jgi:serine protease
VTIVGGHEYAETLTDEYPPGGWLDSSQGENGDKCAWVSSGQGASQNITLSTGTFAVQSTWANDFNSGTGGCEISHPIVTDPNSPTVANPGAQTTTAGHAVSLQMSATENSNPCTCTFSASGLPKGLTISSAGLISGTPTKSGTSTVTVLATDPSNVAGSTSFTWKILAGPATKLTVSPSSANVVLGGTQKFSAMLRDQYGNPVSVPSATWSTTAPGTVSPATGGSTTFTASSSTTGSGTVTATASGFTGAANVNVTTNPIINGGFETGVLSPWSASGTTAESVVPTGSYGCHAGSYCARLGSTAPTNGSSNIAQTFTAPTGSTTLSLYYKVVCPDTVTYDWATVTLRDNTVAVTYTVLPKTCSNSGAWGNATHSVVAGHQYTLTLTSHDDNYAADPTYTLFDDVVVH